jgi:hypothetical protein
MQTFLPYENFEESARALDSKRLGKQRVETWQVLRAIRGETKGWRNHPASVMWRGYEKALIIYGLTMCKEWKRRGYNDTMTARFEEELQKLNGPLEMPSWLGSSEFHISHQSNLLRKSEETYKPLFPDVPADLPYVWPGEKSTVEEKIK